MTTFKEQFIIDVLKKQELNGLDPFFAQKELDALLETNDALSRVAHDLFLKENHRAAGYKLLVKALRKRLRDKFGVYHLQTKKKTGTFSDDDVFKLLQTHRSTNERLSFYAQVYGELFAKIVPTSIHDLGCGLNPLSSIFLPTNVTYYAFDLPNKDLHLLQTFFQTRQQTGSAAPLDLMDLEAVDNAVQRPDTIFLFKVLDDLERGKRGHSKKLLELLLSKHPRMIVISFPTQTIGGKQQQSHRGWLVRVLTELGVRADSFVIPTELFFVVKL
ncbi:MAG: hypothetical protein H6502_01830 [Candidatus Woesearchaeota archaeon]|nr:MAG: hypothetical protein H6502_01830 [Candidatus Woesearchaeota archaeon]